MKSKISLETFNKLPVSQAVVKNAVPAMLTMLMFLIYNLADTLFIGMTHDAYQVAAISLTTPLFMMFTAFANIFGMGGLSVISRAMGEQKTDYARKVSSFCTWMAVGVGVLLAAVFLIFARPILNGLGASSDTLPLAHSYLCIVTFSGPFTMMSGAFSKLLMADGQPKKAMMGSMLGNLLNIVLDPIFILAFHWNIAGAAIATLISNVIAAAYYILYFMRNDSSLSINIKDFSARDKICTSVLAIGIPAALGALVMGVSTMFVNRLMASYGDMALAGIGVAMKITMITGMLCTGIGQGIQPLLGYCVGAKDLNRYKETLKFSLLFAFAVSIAMTVLCYLFTGQIVGAFLTEADAFDYAFRFGRIFLSTSALFGVFYVLLNSLQAMGAAVPALIVNISRQGLIYIPVLYILNATVGVNGLAWAQPVADVLSLVLVAGLSVANSRKRLAGTNK